MKKLLSLLLVLSLLLGLTTGLDISAAAADVPSFAYKATGNTYTVDGQVYKECRTTEVYQNTPCDTIFYLDSGNHIVTDASLASKLTHLTRFAGMRQSLNDLLHSTLEASEALYKADRMSRHRGGVSTGVGSIIGIAFSLLDTTSLLSNVFSALADPLVILCTSALTVSYTNTAIEKASSAISTLSTPVTDYEEMKRVETMVAEALANYGVVEYLCGGNVREAASQNTEQATDEFLQQAALDVFHSCCLEDEVGELKDCYDRVNQCMDIIVFGKKIGITEHYEQIYTSTVENTFNILEQNVNITGYKNLVSTSACSTVSVTSTETTLTQNQKAVTDTAERWVGSSYSKNACQGFVWRVYNEAGICDDSGCCAASCAAKWTVGTSTQDIPIGAAVYFTGCGFSCECCGRDCGHVGIYVGDGCIIHAWNGMIRKDSISYITEKGYKFTGYGWNGGISLGLASTVSESNREDIAEGTYILSNSGYYVAVTKDSNSRYSLCTSASISSASTSVQWQISKDGSGGYRIMSKSSADNGNNRNMNVYTSYTSSSGNTVSLWSNTGDGSQRWAIYKETGAYSIRPIDNISIALTRSGSSLIVETYTGKATQLWSLEIPSVASSTESYTECTISGNEHYICVGDVSLNAVRQADGRNTVNLDTFGYTESQLWYFHYDMDSGLYTIQSYVSWVNGTHRYLNTYGEGATKDGAEVTLWNDSSTRWKLLCDFSTGKTALVPADNPSLALTRHGSSVCVEQFTGADNQIWNIY